MSWSAVTVITITNDALYHWVLLDLKNIDVIEIILIWNSCTDFEFKVTFFNIS